MNLLFGIFSLGILILFTGCNKNHSIQSIDIKNVNPSEFTEILKDYPNYKIIESQKWTDASGTYYLLVNHLPKRTINNDPDFPGTEIQEESMIVLFLNEKKQKIAEKKIHESAPLDLFVKYIQEATEITDIDGDNKAEAFVLIEHVTRGDVSPSDLSVIGFSNQKIFVKKGSKLLTLTKGDPMEKEFPNGLGGEVDDSGLKEAPEKIALKLDKIYRKYYKEEFSKHFQQN